MKLSKTGYLVLITGILIVAVASLGFTYAKQIEALDQLNADIAIAEKRLSNFDLKDLSSQKAALDEQAEQIQAELETARSNLCFPVDSIEETDILFEIARSCNVKLMDLSTSGISQETIADVNCAALTYNARAEGKVDDLIDFIIKLNTDFTTGMVKSADINIPDDADENEARAATHLQFVVYNYNQGD